jgi:hypothetical protein
MKHLRTDPVLGVLDMKPDLVDILDQLARVLVS